MIKLIKMHTNTIKKWIGIIKKSEFNNKQMFITGRIIKFIDKDNYIHLTNKVCQINLDGTINLKNIEDYIILGEIKEIISISDLQN